MKRITWNDAWSILIYTICLVTFSTTVVIIILPRKVISYSLTSLAQSSDGVFSIEKHYNWGLNDQIKFDKTITVEEATRSIERLNQTVK